MNFIVSAILYHCNPCSGFQIYSLISDRLALSDLYQLENKVLLEHFQQVELQILFFTPDLHKAFVCFLMIVWIRRKGAGLLN